MLGVPLSIQDILVAYDADGRSAHVLRTREELSDPNLNCLFGFFDFSDDASVHADHWERHPESDEVLCFLEGRLAAWIDGEDGAERAVIGKDQAVIVPQGRWHRLEVREPGRLVVFRPGAASELRPLSKNDRRRGRIGEGDLS